MFHLPASSFALFSSFPVNGFASGGRSSVSGSSTGPVRCVPLMTSICRSTMPATSVVCPAISPFPCIACISPRYTPPPRNFYRTDQHGTFPDTVYVHMAIGAFFKLLFGHAVVVRSVDQELSEVPGIMGVGEGTGRRGPQLAEEW